MRSVWDADMRNFALVCEAGPTTENIRDVLCDRAEERTRGVQGTRNRIEIVPRRPVCKRLVAIIVALVELVLNLN